MNLLVLTIMYLCETGAFGSGRYRMHLCYHTVTSGGTLGPSSVEEPGSSTPFILQSKVIYILHRSALRSLLVFRKDSTEAVNNTQVHLLLGTAD